MTDLLVVAKDLCVGASSLVRIDEHHNLEVHSWDCRRSLGLIALFSPFPHQDLNTFGVTAVLTSSFIVALYSFKRVALEFPHVSGSRWFSA